MVQEKEKKIEESLYEDELKEPILYQVILHNDDYTTMDFVVAILVEIFRKSIEDAERIMLTVHKHQKAVVGVYTYEIAEIKVERTMKRARDAGYPLLCTFEPYDNTYN